MSPMHPEALELLAKMIAVDDAASRDGLRDTPFRIIFSHRGAILTHPWLEPETVGISRRGAMALRAAGLFDVALDDGLVWDVYLVADATARVAGMTQSAATARSDTESQSKPRERRSRALPNPRAAFERALVETAIAEARLSKVAVGGRMPASVKTLNGYIKEGLIPPPPWEGLLQELMRPDRPR